MYIIYAKFWCQNLYKKQSRRKPILQVNASCCSNMLNSVLKKLISMYRYIRIYVIKRSNSDTYSTRSRNGNVSCSSAENAWSLPFL